MSIEVYTPGAGLPPVDTSRCRSRVVAWDAQCCRKPTTEADGIPVCGLHDPKKIAARQARAMKKYDVGNLQLRCKRAKSDLREIYADLGEAYFEQYPSGEVSDNIAHLVMQITAALPAVQAAVDAVEEAGGKTE